MWLGTIPYKSKELAKENIKAAYEAGYIGIDTAWVYNTKSFVGMALKELNDEGIFPKVQTKIWTDDFGKDVKKVFLNHIKELNQEKVYSLLLHRPSIDFNLSIKAWKELIELKKEGLVEHIGVSNFDKDMLLLLVEQTGVTPEFNQIELSVSNWRADRVHVNNQMGITIQGWSPLGKDIKKNLDSPIVKKLAKKYKKSEGTILLSLLTTLGIDPVAGSSKPERVKTNYDTVVLDESEINKLLELNVFDNAYEETYPH